MSFWEKSNLAVLMVCILGYGAYFALAIPSAVASGPSMEDIGGLLAGVLILAIVATVVAHIVIAAAAPRDVDDPDERDTVIERHADARGYYVLATASIVALILAFTGRDIFWVAHTLLAGLAISEIAKGAQRAIAYRRGV